MNAKEGNEAKHQTMNMATRLLSVTAGITLPLLAGGLLLGYFKFSAPKYQGPPSDHFNGEKFYNIGNVSANGGLQVLRWMLTRDKTDWVDNLDENYKDAPPRVVKGDSLRITFINHATLLIQTAGLNILTDPIWSERTSPVSWAGPRRKKLPGIRFEDLPPIDLVVISHNHYDHLDIPTLQRLSNRDAPQIYTPLGVAQFLEQEGIKHAKDMDWWDKVQLQEEVQLHCVPAQHFSGRGLGDRDATLWAGYIIHTPRGNIYFAGDTGYGPFVQEIKKRFNNIRLALLPIGAYKPEWFMRPIHVNPAEAVQMHLDLNARQSIGMHFGTFQLADEGEQEPLEALSKALKQKNVKKHQFITLREGEALFLE